jgi:putative ABC transport system permease protein
MGVVWHKVWRDLTHNLPRTCLAVLSIAAGVFALGLAFGGLEVMHAYIEADKLTTHPAHLTFRNNLALEATFDQSLVEAARQKPGVAEAEGETLLPIRWKREGETEWRKGTLVARYDYTQQQINRVDLLSGQWPTVRHSLAVERKTAAYFTVPRGAAIVVEAGSSERRLPIVGTVRKPYVLPPEYGGEATFFATPETAAWLTGIEGFNKLRLRLTDFGQPAGDRAAREVRDWLERLGFAGADSGAATDEFQAQGMQDILEGVFLILVVMGALSLGLSAFLIINTLNALLTQQVWQIGVMKVLGARFRQVAGPYLAMALMYGLLALPLAAPAGAWGAYGLAGWMLEITHNLTLPRQWPVSPTALAAQIIVSAVVPVLAALPPVLHAARVTPREAINTCGLGLGFGASPFDRLLENLRGLPRPLALSLRNTFRRKERLALTLLTLTFVGALFVMVMSTRASLDHGLEILLNGFQYDAMVVFARPQRSLVLAEVAAGLPGVTRFEVWGRQNARLLLAEGAEREVGLYGAPPETRLFQPQVVSGRNLLPQDDRAILLNRNLATEAGLQVGDTLTLAIAGQKTAWTVVGLILNATVGQNDNFVPFSALTRAVGNFNEGNMLLLAAAEHEAQAQARLVAAVNQACAARHVETLTLQSASQFRESAQLMFSAVTLMLMVMVIVAAGVGGIGLMGTLSINVIERQREIGVLRAIGARPAHVLGLFVTEGLVVGALSWALALPLSYPAALLFSQALGQTILGTPLAFSYSFAGVILWLALVLALAAVASLWPALGASRITVREALAYE